MHKDNLNILIADDEIDVIEAIKAFFDQLAVKFKDLVTIYTAYTATEVLQILSNNQIDVLFLDYHFEGGMNGDEIIEMINDYFNLKIIILMSARERKELEGIIIKRSQNLGSRFKFLRKPFDYLEIQHKYLEMRNFFANLPYPFPLAHSHKTLLACQSSLEKIIALKDLLETITKYSVAILTADAERLNVTQKIKINISWKGELTFGAWLTWLRALLNYFQKSNENFFMPELINFFVKSSKSNTDRITIFTNFKNEIRDRELGHGFVKEEGWYSEICKNYREPLERLFGEFAFTTKYVMVIPKAIDFADDGLDEFNYTARILMGAETRFPLKSFRTKSRLKLHEIYLVSPKGHIISLNPFIIFRTCVSCSLNRIYYIDGFSSKHLIYNSFCNHRLRDEQSKIDFDQKFKTIMT